MFKKFSTAINPTADLQSDYRLKWYYELIPLAIIIVFVIVVRSRLLGFPLERDEGGFAYIGRLILQGEYPYKDAYDFKPPGLYLVYALILSIFGRSAESIHLGLLIVNVASIILIFFISKKILSLYGAIFSSITYAILSLSSSVLGFAAHATHFVVFFALTGLLVLIRAEEKDSDKTLFAGGLITGTAFLMKQPGICFSLVLIVYVVLRQVFLKSYDFKRFMVRVFFMTVSSVIPFGLSAFIMFLIGILDEYWFWNFEYTGFFAGKIDIQHVWAVLLSNFQHVVNGFYLIWILAGLGLILLIFQKRSGINKILILCLVSLSLVAVSLGFHFRDHYFIMFLPALSLLVGNLFSYLTASIFKKSFLKLIPVGVFLVGMGIGIIEQQSYLFSTDPVELSHLVYGRNPFSESVEISNFIKGRTSTEEKIAVIGSEPQIYFYSERNAATKYLFTYFFMERHPYSLEMQKEFTQEIVQNKPKMIVYANIPTSWLRLPDSEMYVFTWFNEFIQSEYDVVGVVDILSKTKTVFKWNSEAKLYNPRSEYNLYIFERKSNL